MYISKSESKFVTPRVVATKMTLSETEIENEIETMIEKGLVKIVAKNIDFSPLFIKLAISSEQEYLALEDKTFIATIQEQLSFELEEEQIKELESVINKIGEIKDLPDLSSVNKKLESFKIEGIESLVASLKESEVDVTVTVKTKENYKLIGGNQFDIMGAIISLHSLFSENDLGYISKNTEDVIKKALWIKNQDVDEEYIKSLNYDIKESEAIITDPTGERKGNFKVLFDNSFEEEWQIDKSRIISSQDLGLNSLNGELKPKGTTGLTLLNKKDNPILDLDNKASYKINSIPKDFAWVREDLYLGIDNNTDQLNLFKFVEKDQIEIVDSVSLSYNTEKPSYNFKWDLIDRIDENNYSLVNATEWNGTAGRTSTNVVTRVKVDWDKLTGKANIEKTIGTLQYGVYKSFTRPDQTVNKNASYYGTLSTAILKGQRISVGQSFISNPSPLPKDLISIAEAKMYRGENTITGKNKGAGWQEDIHACLKPWNEHYLITFVRTGQLDDVLNPFEGGIKSPPSSLVWKRIR
ncbi:DnaD family protein [Mesoplasma seiffertii]|uniref:DnaD family protein n=1 Tax=Mesoplasma seiffertii TaxID=28224 RepID=UPI00047B4FC9|nr:DnaD family protein [Mesoplasma seiffertii]